MDIGRLKRSVYNAAQWTWGLPQTLAGAGLYLMHRKAPHFNYNGARVTAWDRDSGISLGKFLFVPAEKQKATEPSGAKAPSEEPVKVSSFLLEHEYGHSIQSLLLGPAYLLLVGLPSLAWNRLPYFARKRRKTGRSYYSAVFERTASELGARTAVKEKTKTSNRVQ